MCDTLIPYSNRWLYKESPYLLPNANEVRDKVMFLHLSVSHSVHRGLSTWAGTPRPGTPQPGTPPDRYQHTPTPSQVHPQAGTPPGTPPWQVHPGQVQPPQLPGHSVCWDMVNKQAVHIPLECILVSYIYFSRLHCAPQLLITSGMTHCNWTKTVHQGNKRFHCLFNWTKNSTPT